MTAIIRLRRLLPSIRRFAFTATSGPGSKTGWNGKGQGTLESIETNGQVRFIEAGQFLLDGQPRPVPMRNVYRWVPGDARLSLLHERRGPEAAVHLFDLVQAEDGESLVNEAVHQCVDDAYSARLTLREEGFDLTWRIVGPKKDEHIDYQYRR